MTTKTSQDNNINFLKHFYEYLTYSHKWQKLASAPAFWAHRASCLCSLIKNNVISKTVSKHYTTPQYLQDLATLLLRAYHVCLCNFIFSCVLFVFDFEILWKMICRCIRGFCIFHAPLVCTWFNVTYARTAIYGSLNAMLSWKKGKKYQEKCTALKVAKSQRMFSISSLLQKKIKKISVL